MKHLSVQWLPETVAIISLTVAPVTEAKSVQPMQNLAGVRLNDAPGKLIVIRGGGELCAQVATLQ